MNVPTESVWCLHVIATAQQARGLTPGWDNADGGLALRKGRATVCTLGEYPRRRRTENRWNSSSDPACITPMWIFDPRKEPRWLL